MLIEKGKQMPRSAEARAVLLIAGLVCLAVLATGCGVGCNLILLPGYRVTVLDSITREPITDPGVVVVAMAENYADTAATFGAGMYAGADGRSGLLRLEVTAPGYRAWVADIWIETDECGNLTTEFEAKMQREP